MENFVSLTHLCPCNVFSSCSLPLLPPLVPDSVDLRPWSDSTPNQNGGWFAQKANCRSVYLRDLKNVIFFLKKTTLNTNTCLVVWSVSCVWGFFTTAQPTRSLVTSQPTLPAQHAAALAVLHWRSFGCLLGKVKFLSFSSSFEWILCNPQPSSSLWGLLPTPALAAFHSPTLQSRHHACCSPKIPFGDCSVSLSPAIPRENKRGLAISSKTIPGQLLKLTSLFRKTQPLEIMNAANSFLKAVLANQCFNNFQLTQIYIILQ